MRKERIFFLFTVTLLFLGFLLTSPQNLSCQNAGFKYLKNHTPAEYGRKPRNWTVLQDKRGIIYVGNNKDLLEYDGVSWRQISVTNHSVRSMAIDETGRIYIGGKDEFGFLALDSKGSLQYKSLLDHLENNTRDFGNVWRTHSTKDGIYSRTSKFLFRWNPGSSQIKVWKPEPEHTFNASFTCEGKFFIHQRNIGLKQMVNDSLTFIRGENKLADVKIYMMAQYDSQKLLIGTRSRGFYIYDGIKTVPFYTEADNYLKEKKIYHGIRLFSGDFALATLLGGLVIIDSQGRFKEIYNKAFGLQDDNVKYVFQDIQGNLWLCLDKGISKIEYISPFSFYDDRSNLPGIIFAVTRHGPGNDLYAGTSRGLYYLVKKTGKPAAFVTPAQFRPVPDISTNCWCLLSIGDSLLAATTDGVFQVDKNMNIIKLTKNPSYVLLQSGKDKKRLWVGTLQGLISLYLKESNGQWALERKFENITQEIRTLVEDQKGNLWLATRTRGVLKVDFLGPGTIKNPVVTGYFSSHRLPRGEINVFMAAGKVMFASEQGIFRFDELNNVFIPETSLGEEFAGSSSCSRGVFRIVEDKNKNIWLHSSLRNFQAILQPHQTFVINKKPFHRLPDGQVGTIYPDPGGDTVWLASDVGLIRYNIRIKKNYHQDFPTLVRKVIVNGKLIFDGYQHKELFPIIPYKDRNLRFEFAAPFFENETSTQYQSFLEGYDEGWSVLNSETRKDYTNLDPGRYTSRVRGLNVHRNLSKEAVFQFKVLPPWYKTWWAVLFYAIAIIMVVFFIVKWRSGKLEREKQRLEQIVHQRTKEIEAKNQQLQEQSEKLKEVDKMKSRFFANISHEFRTPLTLILGPLEQMLAQTHPDSVKEQKKKLKLMIRNSKRLLNLINQLLDLSKFESGKMKLKTCQQNIIPFLRGILASFETLADQTELDLQFHTEEKNITLYFDPEKLEKVFTNLISNAFKFTPGGGRIDVIVTKNTAAKDNFPAGSVDITVRDTGSGIPESQKAYIFEHFYQVDVLHSHEHPHKGSGIGLALTKELISLHHGEIHVRDSEGPGSGTEFIVRLPMGKEHLEPDEVKEDSESPFEPSGPAEIPAFDEAELEKEEEDSGGEEESSEDKDIDSETPEKNIVLVVEDSADVRTYIRGALDPLYIVEEAADGLEGIKKAKEIIPDLIISDIIMPGADGYELCRVLKKDVDTSHIPIILLTAKASDENVLTGLETGADEYIIKPFNTKILCARIKNMVDLRRQLQMKLDREMKLQSAEISVSTIDKKFIINLQDVIEKNLSEPDFNVENLRKKLSMSQPTLYRKILALSGKSPTEFIKSYRLKRAAQLLESGFGSVTEVAFEVGFASRTYFTKCFKEKFHQLPSEYQNGRTH